MIIGLFCDVFIVTFCPRLWTTLLALIPSSWNLLRKPTFNAFLVALVSFLSSQLLCCNFPYFLLQVNSSLTFFLFSYQVHEKSILLPALYALKVNKLSVGIMGAYKFLLFRPLTLLLPHCSFPAVWFHTVATFRLLPCLAIATCRSVC